MLGAIATVNMARHFVIAGGHTAEMLSLACKLDLTVYRPRCYVVGQTDALGRSKAAAAEQKYVKPAGVKPFDSVTFKVGIKRTC